jgi:hypothetical protein
MEMRPGCECCGVDLPAGSTEAMVCSFECTFCRACTEHRLGGVCPTCGGELVRRPTRTGGALLRNPASTVRHDLVVGCS